MKGKKLIPIIIAAVVVIGVVIFYFVYSSSGYSAYNKAFTSTFDVDSMDIKTSVKATIDGSLINSTGSFKIKGLKGDPNKVEFVNSMIIGGKEITQFSDGKDIYIDDGAKYKMSLGSSSQEPAMRQGDDGDREFSYEAYISEFSRFLDAGKIKELNSLEPVAEKYVKKISTSNVSGGKRYDVELLPELISKLTEQFLDENISTESLKPTVNMNKVVYAVIIKDGYISEIAFHLEMDVTAPGETEKKAAVVELSFQPQNPGKSVDFSLPSTEGY